MRERARPPIHRCLFRGRGRALGGGEGGGGASASLAAGGRASAARGDGRGGWRAVRWFACVPASGEDGWVQVERGGFESWRLGNTSETRLLFFF